MVNAKDFRIRRATATDIPALARLHVATFIETHGGPGPTVQTREHQWRQIFAADDGTWFCLVIENPAGELIGFAKGQPYTHPEHGEFKGNLNKIYLLRQYHRQGLGRRLLHEVAREFLERGIESMLLFGDAKNPSNGFYERMGAQRLHAPNGEFHGGYAWADLRPLVAENPR